MNKKNMKDKIREILKKHNEWDAFDDEVEDGYASVEYHKETLDKVVSEIATLCEEQLGKTWYVEGDEVVIKKGKWVICRLAMPTVLKCKCDDCQKEHEVGL